MNIRRFFLTLFVGLIYILPATAFTVNFAWNIPGAAEIKADSFTSDVILGPDSDEATSFSYQLNKTGWMYLVAKDGYKIEAAEINGVPTSPSMYYGYIYVGKYITDNTNIKVTLAEIERTAEIDIDVVNGADYISLEFNNGYKVSLVNGENKVMYDPAMESSLTLSPYNGPTDFYSVTLNGKALSKRNQYSSAYDINTLTPGDKVVIRVFEGEEPVVKQCIVKVIFATGMEDCIYSIYNRSTSKFETLVDDELSVRSGNTLLFNFKDKDYDYKKFILNDKDVTSDFSNYSLPFVVEDDIILQIEGTGIVYPEVDFTALVMNPEGVIFYLGGYQKKPADLTGGEEIPESIMLGLPDSPEAVEMTTENTREFKISVSSRHPYVYVAPQDGWYIYTVKGYQDNELVQLSNVTTDTPTFYVVAYPFDGFRTVTFDVRGDTQLLLTGSSVKSNLWDNPEMDYSLTEGVQQIEFLPGYNLPLSLRSLETIENMGVYLDGVPLTEDDNNIYTFTPWYPKGTELQEVESKVTVICNGEPAQTSRVRLETEDDMEATVYYSAVRHELKTSGQTLLAGTEIIVKPEMADCTIKLNDEVVYGLGADDNFVGVLNDDGEFIFDAPFGQAVITVSKGCGFTGISSISGDASCAPAIIYTIDGRRLPVGEKVERGLYIIDGRKVVITSR